MSTRCLQPTENIVCVYSIWIGDVFVYSVGLNVSMCVEIDYVCVCVCVPVCIRLLNVYVCTSTRTHSHSHTRILSVYAYWILHAALCRSWKLSWTHSHRLIHHRNSWNSQYVHTAFKLETKLMLLLPLLLLPLLYTIGIRTMYATSVFVLTVPRVYTHSVQ